ncbi:hypothetical protein RRF57_000025 [Xylaria bambusicola]|uniref:Uncharacterized protein n=1 Tax=Xylaria bambusicola TaxID=326684 RepID=A0AAN7U942_9PEZI
MAQCCGTHDLYELLAANGASEIAGVFILIPLMSAAVAKDYLSPLSWFEMLSPRRHSALPGLIVSGKGGEAEAER